MQGKRVWLVVLATGAAALLTWYLTDRPSGDGLSAIADDATVPEIADRLAQAGLGCEAVIRNEPPPEDERNELGTVESALCQVGGAPNLAAAPVHALIIAYDTDRDERPGNPMEPEGHALIYGERWEVYVPSRAAADAVHDALGGQLELPDEFFVSPSPSG
jgi:hypothetical protein